MSIIEEKRDEISSMDAADPLAHLREKFVLNADEIYLDGNSLGPLPKATPERLARVIESEWGKDLIRSWNTNHWIDYPARIGERIAKIIGAAPGTTLCVDSVSNNLFKLLAAALALRPERRVILSLDNNFPTDLYIAQGLQSLIGRDRCELRAESQDALESAIDESVAVVMLTEVNFRTGERLPMKTLTQRAHDAGALALWDLSHSAGAVPVALEDCDADFAVGCGYKFLNGGPGAPAFLYAASRHHDHLTQPLTGWMGHARPFDFPLAYEPAPGIQRFASGTPSILAMAALDSALDVFDNVDMRAVREKSLALSDLFIELVESSPVLKELSLASPRDHSIRGSQVCFRHPNAFPMIQALIAEGVIGDFREPDILRFGITPLYLRYADIAEAVKRLEGIVETGRWREPVFNERSKVT